MPRFLSRLLGSNAASLPVTVALLSLPLVVVTGGALDLVAYERMRARLQDSVDRGVLAAASLRQAQGAQETVRSFVDSASGFADYAVSVTEERSTNERRVSAHAEGEVQTNFLRLIGIDTMAVTVDASAEESRKNIEVSLILDVSGSMRWDSANRFPGLTVMTKRIDFLRPAAKDFLDIVLSDDARDYTTVSLVPYAGQVNVGADLFELLGGTKLHSKSSCFEFAPNELTIGMPSFRGRAQTPHFTHFNHHDAIKSLNERKLTQPWWCPDDPHGTILSGLIDFVPGEGDDRDVTSVSLMSNDREALKHRIDNYKLYDGTGTPVALKWGLLFLDPAFQPTVDRAFASPSRAASLGLRPEFRTRPARFDDEGSEKFIVLMTDGAVSQQFRPKDRGRKIHYSDARSDGTNDEVTDAAVMERGVATLCTQAKANGVIVFTIGFDVNDSVARQMTDCATGPGHFYRVTSSNVAQAFTSIATQIQKIRLVR